VQAAACQDEVTAELSRRHNDLNILCLSGDMLSSRSIERVVEVWMKTDFKAASTNGGWRRSTMEHRLVRRVGWEPEDKCGARPFEF
jgi:ribose 5-phosphate isomerase RpiB